MPYKYNMEGEKDIATKKATKGGFDQHPENINRDGKGGFGDHPENRSDGRWRGEDSYKYNINKFKAMPLGEFIRWKDENPNATMAQLAAYVRVEKSIDKLDEFREAADRTEGKPRQHIFQDIKGEMNVNSATDELLRRIDGIATRIGTATENKG